MIQDLIATLYAAGLEPAAEEIADIVWLAAQMGMPTFDYAEMRLSRLSRQVEPTAQNSNSTQFTLGLRKERSAEVQLQNAANGMGRSEFGTEGLPFHSPAAFALPQTLEIGRALRPLKRNAPSRSQFILDVDATVQRIADTKALLPVLLPAAERWLDLVLVVDASPSMLIWRQTVAELRSLLGEIGAFHTIQTWYLAVNALHPRLYARSDVIHLPQHEHHPHELIDPNGRQLILILSDFVASYWNIGEIAQMLNTWGQTGMVALVQMLPQQLWPRTALANAQSVYLRSRHPGTANAELEIELKSRRFGRQPRVSAPLPMVTLEPDLLASWSQLMVGDSQTWTPGLAFALDGTTILPQHQQESSEQVTAHKLVQQFQAVASPIAQLLAGYLTAVPLSLQTMRLVQKAMFKNPQQVHLAEVLLSGLIQQVTPHDEMMYVDDIRYEFIDGVSDLLLDTVLISDMDTVLCRISNFIEEGTGRRIEFNALLSNPTLSSKIQLMPGNRTFAFVPFHVLRRLGGKYAQLAEQLQQRRALLEVTHPEQEQQILVPKHQPEFALELPYGTVFPTSPFYIERDADRDCKLYFRQGRAVTVFIKGPGQVGKSSLIQRINHLVKAEQDVAIAYVNLGRFESRLLGSLESFLIEFCRQIGDALNISDGIDQYWSMRRGAALAKCSRYMTDHILSGVSKPLILAIDEIENLLDTPFGNNFFGMLRTWHNDRAQDQKFQQLSLFLSSSTEPHLLINNLNQSPFNVAQPIELHDFTVDEVRELNRRYTKLLNEEEIMMLMDLLNGHPFLTHLALYTTALKKCELETLLQSASAEGGLFYDHLSPLWQQSNESPELMNAVRQICRNQTYPENRIYYRLKGAGLIRRINGNVVMRNKLYERFFAERLGIVS